MRWYVFGVFTLAYVVLSCSLWLHRDDDAGQAMPMDSTFALLFWVAGGAVLALAAITLVIF